MLSLKSKTRLALLCVLFQFTTNMVLLAQEPPKPEIPASTGDDAPEGSDTSDTVKSEKSADERQQKNDDDAGEADPAFPNRRQAPDGILGGPSEWINSSGPISLRDLRGKVVLLDFWTYCCINCIHVLPDLKYFEKKYPNELVVIGVHSAKFDNEKESDNIREAVMRYEIEHPVVNDNEMLIWKRFGTRSWPTLAIIDPEGYYLGSQSGEGNRELIDSILEKVITHHREKGTLDETPVEFKLERDSANPTPLRYPGKVLADKDSDRLFIADSNHNRIVVTTLDGTLQDVIGVGGPGMRDGGYDDAMFNHPQGMSLRDDTLYVADTENHAIRTVNLKTETVSTLAGIGEQSRVRIPRGPVDSIALNSPWALQLLDDQLFIAMAGPHQLWSHKLGSETIGVYAGSGREDIVNGTLREAALAQPSGLTTDGESLFVVDSEGSAVRKITLGEEGEVSTIAGASDLPRGRALFEFGDHDGIGKDARLQHPLGIAWNDGTLFVADSYNHKLRTVDIESQETATWMGTGEPGAGLDPPQFSEPGGVSIAGEFVFVADTNNHRICVANIAEQTMSVLTIDDLAPPSNSTAGEQKLEKRSKALAVEEQSFTAGMAVNIDIKLDVPDEYKINELTPILWKLTTTDETQTIVAADAIGQRMEAEHTSETTARVTVPLTEKRGSATFELSLSYGYCRGGVGGLCKMRTVRWELPVTIVDETGHDKPLSLAIPQQ